MATITDVAERAQVSVATVSRALRGLPNVAVETRERVHRAAEELEYVADPSASRLAARRTSTVGLVVPALGKWYYSQIFAGVESVLAAAGVDVLPFPLIDRTAHHRFLERLPFRKRVDGLIFVDVPMDEQQADRLQADGTSVLVVGAESRRFSSLIVDDVLGARMAADHLLSLGHDRIGLLGGGDTEAFAFTVPNSRRLGFIQGLQAQGLHPDPSLHVDAEVSMRGGVLAMQQVLGHSDRPTAVFALSDEMAIGAMQVASSLGMEIPGDLSIVGFDDHDVSEYIGLTTIRQDVIELGATAATWMLDITRVREGGRRHVQRPQLIVRRTTAKPGHL